MMQAKLSFGDFTQGLNAGDLTFVQDIHGYMLNNGCKATFEEKKTGLLGSYKHTKSKKSILNLLIKKHGLLVRIYGENISEYRDFLNTLTEEMVQSIDSASICSRLVNNGCSTKCSGYDFTIGNKHFQKCRYNCFEFLVNKESAPYIRAFIENETNARTAA